MNGSKNMFRNKLVWIGLALVVGVIFIMGLAQLGSSSNPVPKNMPVALVSLDKEVQLPNGQTLAIGKMIEQQLMTAAPSQGTEPPLKWERVNSKDTAMQGLDDKKYYSVLILPESLSADIATLFSPQPKAAAVEVYLNQGMNITGANLVSQVLTKIGEGMNGQLRKQVLEGVKAQGDILNSAQAAALASPITLQTEIVHPVPAHSANGNAPVAFTILAWFGAMIASVLTFQASAKARSTSKLSNAGVAVSQAVIGLLYVLVALGATLLLAKSTLGMTIADSWQFSIYFTFISYCFFLMQSCLLNWLGMNGMPIMILIFFFGSPILALPSQMLPAFTQDWLYSWIPLRFGTEILREVLYFGGSSFSSASAVTLIIIGAVALCLSLLAAVVKPYKDKNKAKETAAAESKLAV
ncbi:YhgE/Pip domain-containing protein [Paenibacillus radicis (ex Gao et al. 2016)]|uniref:Phage infection protein n=1 Tax=Paenibacillus radicis (ex Gao et al. 2016) TaxID=1737354 RepID=A0A917HE88_9BACL|nr:ABC transporter permease [Paenibacillus radicis (ex Gao et al. 2016)]GGG75830.1 phage infection protein [Paenibacillus radicis (ex Gao et al. 2016)]